MALSDRIKNAWNAFFHEQKVQSQYRDAGMSYFYRPDRPRYITGGEKSLVTAIYNRIAIDAAAIKIQHVRLDENNRFREVIFSGLNTCLTTDANIDQTGRAFMQDIVMSLLDEGCVAVVPIDTSVDPNKTNSYEIYTMRTGKIIEWFPEYVKVNLYNERTGKKEDVMVRKSNCAIIENPLYAVMNEPNGTLKRLIRKMNLLDIIDEQSGSGKLDLIIQLPYTIKSEARQKQAEERRDMIEKQLAGSKFGIAYADATEHITQLNRPVENNMLKQIEYLTELLYGQLGITKEVINGTANSDVMLNYYNRTIEPILSAIADEMNRKFLTKTARSQGQAVAFYNDPFKLAPVDEIAKIADLFTRNEIMSSNEIRQIIGLKPSDDPMADELRNKNLYPAGDESTIPQDNGDSVDENQNRITGDTPISEL